MTRGASPVSYTHLDVYKRQLLDKTPALMQNLMLAIQQKIVPMLDELQAELKTVAEEEAKAAPAPAKKKK